jgi:DNA modification methylase
MQGRVNNTHITLKPLSLMRYLVILVKQPQRNLVLDPFAGSGTTGLACLELGIPCVLIEREKEYFEIACQRLQALYDDLSRLQANG